MRNTPVVVLSGTTVANGATVYSAVYEGTFGAGFEAVFIKLGATSTVTITQEASMTGATNDFYSVVGSTGGALGAVCSALSTTSGVYVQFSPVLAPYKRLKVVAGAASTITTLEVCLSEQS